MSKTKIDPIVGADQKKEEKLTETEILRFMVLHERILKLKAQKQIAEDQISQIGSAISDSNSDFERLRVSTVEKYKLGIADSFDIGDGKITRIT